MGTKEIWFKVQTKATALVLFRGTDYNDVLTKARNATMNGWVVEVVEDATWGKMPKLPDSQFQGVGPNPATAGATFNLATARVVGN